MQKCIWGPPDYQGVCAQTGGGPNGNFAFVHKRQITIWRRAQMVISRLCTNALVIRGYKMQKCILEPPDYQSVCGQTRNYHLGVEQQLALWRQERIIQRRTSQKKTVGQWRPVECDTRVGQWRPCHESQTKGRQSAIR